MNETKYPTYGIWLNALEAITRQELGLDLRDLPDVLTLDDYQAGVDPEDAYQNYLADHWEDFDPEAMHESLLQSIDDEPGSDADPGL